MDWSVLRRDQDAHTPVEQQVYQLCQALAVGLVNSEM
jgi:hypothetical protein